MSDLISRQEVINLIMTEGMYCDTDADKEYSAEKIKALPSAEPKKGTWIETEQPMGWDDVHCATCSECGEDYVLDEYMIEDLGWNFCPNCGADMREET